MSVRNDWRLYLRPLAPPRAKVAAGAHSPEKTAAPSAPQAEIGTEARAKHGGKTPPKRPRRT